jgi:hypothetical protein
LDNLSTHLLAVKEEFDILCVGSIVQKRESLTGTFWERRIIHFKNGLKTAVEEWDRGE